MTVLHTSPPLSESPKMTPLDAALTGRLRSVAARVRRYVLIEGCAWTLSFLLVVGFIQFLLDYGTRGLQLSMRAVILALIVLGAGMLTWRRIVTPLRKRIGLADIAKLVERKYPELSSLLISAVRFASGEVGPEASNSRDLMRQVIGQAQRRAESIDVHKVLNPTRALWSMLALVLGLLAIGGISTWAPDMMGRWFARNVLLQEVEWPRRTHLIVELEGDELIGARGDDVVIQAYATGVQPRVVEIIYETVSGVNGRETMVTVGSRDNYGYRYTLKNAQEDLEFYLIGGDDQTRRFRLHLHDRPHVTETEIHIRPPAYTRLEAVDLADGERTARILPGSKVTVRIQTNKAITRATLMADRDVVAEAVAGEDGHSVTWIPTETHTYHFALMDEVGLDNRRPVRISLRVKEDDPPRVRIKLIGAGDMITASAVLPIELEFTDTYGLATAELHYTITRPEAVTSSIELPTFKPHTTTFATSLRWAVATASVAPGDTLVLSASASDFNDVTGPGFAEALEISLRVVTDEELAAELARREQEYRLDFERLIDSQEQVRSGLLTVYRQLQNAEMTDAVVSRLASLERRARSIAGAVNVIRQQFEKILAEMTINELATAEEKKRLSEGIVAPLTELAKRDLVSGADAIRRWSRAGAGENVDQIDPQQAAILVKMRTVLENMVQWEGYQEVVGMLRDLIRIQQQLRQETQEALEDQASDIFDD